MLTNPVSYYFCLSNEEIFMNDLIGKKIGIKYLEKINCIICGNKTDKSFGQGFCYPCYISAPEAAPCILKPELCEAHMGISRDPEWAKLNCLTDHYVYLALTAGLKVGVTRSSQVPTRWIDQGAVKAVKFAKTPNRYIAGTIETRLAKFIPDKTAWQKMLKNEIDLSVDLLDEKHKLKKHLFHNQEQFFSHDDELIEINYPCSQYPEKVKSIDIEKSNEYQGILTGIKGQYLIFGDGSVINIRKYNGYKLELSF
jgi:hypothetical protein